MVKLTGPMMSFGASGTLAKTATFSKWKGRSYARQCVVPANPRSVLQVSTRAMFKFLSQAWDAIAPTPQGSWDDAAAARQYLPFNAYMSANGMRWKEFQAPGQTDPIPETGTAPVATLDSAVGGPSYVDLNFAITTLNNVWGVIIFRSATGTFTPSRANAIAVIPVTATGALVYTDSGLDAGTYYYDAKFFTKEGVLGADEGEVSGAAT